MEWFNHAPTEEGLYWHKQKTSNRETATRICEVAFAEYAGEKHIELFFMGTEYSQEHYDDNINWYYGPIEPPTFNEE